MGHAIMTRVDQVFIDQILEDEIRTMILKSKCSKRVAFTKNINIQRACSLIRQNQETGGMEIASFQKVTINDQEVERLKFRPLRNADKIVFCENEDANGSVPLLFHLIITSEVDVEQIQVSKPILSEIKNPKYL